MVCGPLLAQGGGSKQKGQREKKERRGYSEQQLIAKLGLGGGRAVVNRHVDMSVQSWTTFSLALARLAIPGPHITVAAESSAFFRGCRTVRQSSSTTNAGSGPPESLALQTQGASVNFFGSHSVSKLSTTIFGLPRRRD